MKTGIGIFSLVLFNTQQCTKEIGIRKVNGARTIEIMYMLSKNYTTLVVLAFIIGCPISYFALSRWLQNFAYKTNLSWWFFILAGIIAYLITIFTAGWQSWRAARINPVKALRYE